MGTLEQPTAKIKFDGTPKSWPAFKEAMLKKADVDGSVYMLEGGHGLCVISRVDRRGGGWWKHVRHVPSQHLQGCARALGVQGVSDGFGLSGGERGRTAMRALSRGHVRWKVGVMRAVRRWQLVGRGQHRVPLQ